MEAYADPLQYFEPDPCNDVKPEEVKPWSFFSIKIPSYPGHYIFLSFCDTHNLMNTVKVLEKLKKNDGELKEVNLNNICGISEQLFCDIFNALKNNDKCVKFSACNCDVRLFLKILDLHSFPFLSPTFESSSAEFLQHVSFPLQTIDISPDSVFHLNLS